MATHAPDMAQAVLREPLIEQTLEAAQLVTLKQGAGQKPEASQVV